MADKTRIILADDHAILRAGLRLLLNSQPDMEVVDEAADGLEAVEKSLKLRPDLLLLDLNMPKMDGLAVIEQLKAQAAEIRILVLTMHDDGSYLQQAIHLGASGYVLKKAVDTELLMGIQAVLRGELYVHSAMTQKLLDNTAPDDGRAHRDDPWHHHMDAEYG